VNSVLAYGEGYSIQVEVVSDIAKLLLKTCTDHSATKPLYKYAEHIEPKPKLFLTKETTLDASVIFGIKSREKYHTVGTVSKT